ncbi:MAG: DEAD/DEAH box helicase, partial [Dehalococcoidales bacterium]|nr:DEAD/DEAH box helicase [Dehalococcoidales bacterium]
MDARAVLDYIRSLSSYAGQIVHVEHITPRGANYGNLNRPLAPSLEALLKDRGLLPLYSHQAEALNHIRDGKNVIIATPSASGKTLVYAIAVAQAIMGDPSSRALLLFPTKALAQDQLGKFHGLFSPSVLPYESVVTFDGDTPRSERANVRRHGRVILTNPDMLHVGIMPQHQSWAPLFRNLRYVVIDEAHVYRGVFGSHVACVLRRLRRLCRHYGSSPQFILCSATVANPGEHARTLTGLPCEVVDRDGSPRGAKEFVFWNPPVIDEGKTARRSAHWEATGLLVGLVRQGIRSLVFTRTRRLCELIYVYARDLLQKDCLLYTSD